MKGKRMVIMMISIVLLVSMFTTASYASDISEAEETEISPRATCMTCGSFTVTSCTRDRTRWESGTHSYNFWTKTCHFTDYTSYMVDVCINYGHRQNYRGPHWCWRVHQDCGSGKERVCIAKEPDEW